MKKIIILMLFACSLQAQNTLVDTISTYFNNELSEEIDYILSAEIRHSIKDKNRAIQLAKDYLDPSNLKKERAYIRLINAFITKENTDLNKTIIDELYSKTNYCKIIILEELLHYENENFSENAKKQIVNNFNTSYKNDFYLRLIGNLNLRVLIPSLEGLLRRTDMKDNEFMINAVLARFGDVEKIKYVIDAIEKMPDREKFSYGIDILSFIQNKKAIEQMVVLLKSDSRDEGNDTDIAAHDYASNVIPYLEKLIKGFSKENNIPSARKWFKEHPNYQILSLEK